MTLYPCTFCRVEEAEETVTDGKVVVTACKICVMTLLVETAKYRGLV